MDTSRLKNQVELVLGRKLSASGDYELLKVRLYEMMHILFSTTTLKRVFGYLNEDVTPRRSTLDALARFVGYANYDAFLASPAEAQSNIAIGKRLRCNELAKGQRLHLFWQPNRRLQVRHDGDGNFTILEAENSKLAAGDTFHCDILIANEPMIIDNLIHGTSAPACYIAGRIDGVRFTLVQAPPEE